jgi:tRNA(Ile)-lysidine synthase
VRLTLPTGEAVTAFADAIDRLTGTDCAPVLLAISGGPDSLAMLLLAKAAIPDRIHAVTVDHQLRPESAAEANLVSNLSARLNISHKVLYPEQPITGNLQSTARAVRYDLLTQHADATGCRWIATAHHADDQLETVLMRVARGSGIDGLAGVRARQDRIIRPLLNLRKAQLESICADAGVEPVRDPSNEDSDFDRVAMRQWLAGNKQLFDAKRAVRTAASFADAAEALAWAADLIARDHLRQSEGIVTIDPAGLPLEFLRRLLLRALALVEPGNAPRGKAIDRALHDLAADKRFTQGNVLCQGGDSWQFRPAPPRK